MRKSPEYLLDGAQKDEKGGCGCDDLAWLRELQSQYQEVDGLSSAASKKDEDWLAANEFSQEPSKQEDEGIPPWVGEISASPLDEKESEAEGELSAAGLPSWLDATRPSATPQIIFGMPSDYRGQVEIRTFSGIVILRRTRSCTGRVLLSPLSCR
jgi:hypothetical protein